MKTQSSHSLSAYLAAGIGATAAVSTDAEASIVYFDVDPDQTINLDGAVAFASIDLQNGTYDLNGSSGTTFGLAFDGASGGLFGYLNPTGTVQWGFVGSNVERLTGTEVISGSSPWSWGSAPSAVLLGGYVGADGEWGFSGPNESNTGFAALRIDAGGGNFYYGWAEITAEVGNSFSPPYLGTADITVTGFAFNTIVNEGIEAGAVPEPSSVACLLLGGSAFALSRRRRREEGSASAA